jgi:pimeloyl-ACP methyl ester carboxylesterase
LFVAGENDTEFADSARAFDRAAPKPKRLVLLPSGGHGVDLLRWESGPRTEALVISFLDRITR